MRRARGGRGWASFSCVACVACLSLSLSVGNAEELSGYPLPFGDCTGGCAVVSIWVAHLERDGKGVVCHMVYVAPRFVSTGVGRLEWSLQE